MEYTTVIFLNLLDNSNVLPRFRLTSHFFLFNKFGTGNMAQVLECLPRTCEALSSNSITTKIIIILIIILNTCYPYLTNCMIPSFHGCCGDPENIFFKYSYPLNINVKQITSKLRGLRVSFVAHKCRPSGGSASQG
jgi:hypothetical protein